MKDVLELMKPNKKRWKFLVMYVLATWAYE